MKKKHGIFALFFVFSLLSSATEPLSAQLTLENVHEYIQLGILQYTIDVDFTSIKWQTESESRAECVGLKTKVEAEPDDPKAVIDYLTTCFEAGFEEETRNAAKRYVESFRNLFDDYRNETALLWYLQTVNILGDTERYDTVYEKALPFLEGGDARPETVIAAIENRMNRGDYELAIRIGEFYKPVHPETPELFYKSFLATVNYGIDRAIPHFLQKAYNHFEEEPIGPTTDLDAQLKSIVEEYHGFISDAIRFNDLSRAIELDPGNYSYYLTYAGYWALLQWYYQLGISSINDDINLENLQSIFNDTAPEQWNTALEYLDKAINCRPEEDIQVFLAGSIINMILGKIDKAQQYAKRAIKARPDLYEGYDALLLVILMKNAEKDDPLEGINDQFEALIRKKIAATGGTAYDYYVLATQKVSLIEQNPHLDRKKLWQEMEELARLSLEKERTPLGLVAMGNAKLLQGELETALDYYLEAEGLFQPENRYITYTNRGIAYVLKSNRDRGTKLLREAASMNEETGKAEKTLELLGVESGQ
jgi:hypothetical protein